MPRLGFFDVKMQETLFRTILNILLAVMIYCNAEAGRLLGIPGKGIHISAIWPATGFSLAALLLFGTRTWSGIFFGNFFYNGLHLLYEDPTIFGFFCALSVSLGSLLQALVGNHLMRKFCSSGYFNTMKDTFYFLLFGGFLSCFIAGSIGATALYAFENYPPYLFWIVWLTFCMGDLMGVYIVTPFLIIWSLKRPIPSFHKDMLAMLGAFIGISYVVYLSNFWVAALFVPICFWAAFRYLFHGATLSLAMIAISVAVLLTKVNVMITENAVVEMFLPLIGRLEVLTMATLLFAASLNELSTFLALFSDDERKPQISIPLPLEKIEDLRTEALIKEKIQSFGLLTSGIAKYIRIPLKTIYECVKTCETAGNQFKNQFFEKNTSTENEETRLVEQHLSFLHTNCSTIKAAVLSANLISEVLEEHASITMPGKMHPGVVYLNRLIDLSLKYVITESAKRYPHFICTIERRYDPHLRLNLVFPENLAHALIHLFYNSFYSMKGKKDLEGEDFQPILTVETIDRKQEVEIRIRDNGLGLPKEQLDTLLQSYMDSTKILEEKTALITESIRLGITFAHDVIVHVHHGKITTESEEGKFLELKITLPKES